MKYIKAFVLFWYDFIVGDSMTLAIGVIVCLLVAAGLSRETGSVAPEIALPAIVVATLVLSLRR
jgi:hypothetical protein